MTESKFYVPPTLSPLDLSLPSVLKPGSAPASAASIPLSPTSSAVQSAWKFVIVTDRALTVEETDTLSMMGTLVNFSNAPFQTGKIGELEFDYFVVRLTAASRPWVQLNIGQEPFVWVALTSDGEQPWVHDLPFKARLKKLPDGFSNPAFKAQFNKLLTVNHLPLPKSFLAKNKDSFCAACLGAIGLAGRTAYP